MDTYLRMYVIIITFEGTMQGILYLHSFVLRTYTKVITLRIEGTYLR